MMTKNKYGKSKKEEQNSKNYEAVANHWGKSSSSGSGQPLGILLHGLPRLLLMHICTEMTVIEKQK